MTQTILCKHCQGSIKDTDRFCYYCGKPVNGDSSPIAQEAPEAGLVSTPPPNAADTLAPPPIAAAMPDTMPATPSGSASPETPATLTNGFVQTGIPPHQAAPQQDSSVASGSVLPPSDFAVQTGAAPALSAATLNSTPPAGSPATTTDGTITKTVPTFQTGAPAASGLPSQNNSDAPAATQPPPNQPAYLNQGPPPQPMAQPQNPVVNQQPSSHVPPQGSQADAPPQPPSSYVTQDTPYQPAPVNDAVQTASALPGEQAMPWQNTLEPEPPVAQPRQNEAPIRINTTLEEDLKLEMQESQPVQSSIPFQEPAEMPQDITAEEPTPVIENEETPEITAAPIPENRKGKKAKTTKTKPVKTITRLKADPLAKAKMHAKTKAQEKPPKVKRPRPPFYYLLPHLSTLFSIVMLLFTMVSFYGFNSKAGVFILFPIWPLGLLLFAALMFVTPIREMSGRKIVSFFVKLTLFFNAIVCLLVILAMVTGQPYDMVLVLIWCGGGFILPLIIMFTNLKAVR